MRSVAHRSKDPASGLPEPRGVGGESGSR